VDGDNVYGTHAALHPKIGSTNTYTSGSQDPGFTWINYGPVVVTPPQFLYQCS